jgi:hypothetical protein
VQLTIAVVFLHCRAIGIQPDIHSTDTHGTNEVNFALLYVFGYPQIARLLWPLESGLNLFAGICKKPRNGNSGLVVSEPNPYFVMLISGSGRLWTDPRTGRT